MTPSGIEPATFRFVAQYLNHCATISGPRYACVVPLIIDKSKPTFYNMTLTCIYADLQHMGQRY
jgi:hypothetical protein